MPTIYSEMAISATMCFPLYITLSLLSKAAVVYSVDCTYSRKKFDSSKFYLIIGKIWRRIIVTYLWLCMLIAGCLTLFLVLLVAVSSLFSMIVYPAMIVGHCYSDLCIGGCFGDSGVVEGLFEHRVKTLRFGDGSSRLWEGPLLVVMYSFVVLIDSMMSAVFYFSCKNYSMEASKGESQAELAAMTMSPGTPDIQ
ncbi:unnamed protein product [Ilex paraguariensis]|uniref:Uncharacterized protein n=1 Tax=Ilex paraguariensis TaxID=185542 RepID=A0ABC8S1M4_9AQUA